ncbi:MAG: hypothetical protein K1W24_01840 [Lachnospiraceae bacterium]
MQYIWQSIMQSIAVMASSSNNGSDMVVQIDDENVFRAVKNKDQYF